MCKRGRCSGVIYILTLCGARVSWVSPSSCLWGQRQSGSEPNEPCLGSTLKPGQVTPALRRQVNCNLKYRLQQYDAVHLQGLGDDPRFESYKQSLRFIMFRHTLLRLKPPQLAAEFPINLEALGLSPHETVQQPAQRGSTPNAAQNFSFSKTAERFARKANIGHPFALRILPGQKSKEFPIRISVCPRQTFSFYHLKYLGPFDHPLIDKMIYHYMKEKQSKPLWCYVHGFSATDGSNAVVRQTSERTVRAALFKALNGAGYDSHGKSLDGSKQDLQGTIRVTIVEPKAIMKKFDFGRLVDYLAGFVPVMVPRLSGPNQRPLHGHSGKRHRKSGLDSAAKSEEDRQ